jgi:hypothetical protein
MGHFLFNIANFHFNSFISIYSVLFHFGVYLGPLCVHLFISVSSPILYFWFLEIS